MPLLTTRPPEDIAKAAADIDALMQSMYQGRSVRTPSEFKQDLSALHIAQEVLDRLVKAQRAGEKP